MGKKEEINVNILEEIKKQKATNNINAVPISKLVDIITGVNKRVSPISYNIRYNEIKEKLSRLSINNLINSINKNNRKYFYITRNGLNYISNKR